MAEKYLSSELNHTTLHGDPIQFRTMAEQFHAFLVDIHPSDKFRLLHITIKFDVFVTDALWR